MMTLRQNIRNAYLAEPITVLQAQVEAHRKDKKFEEAIYLAELLAEKMLEEADEVLSRARDYLKAGHDAIEKAEKQLVERKNLTAGARNITRQTIPLLEQQLRYKRSIHPPDPNEEP